MELYVITGGPCTGKTTTCEELHKLGHHIVPEAARQIIREEQPSGILPWTDLGGFQELVLDRQLDLESKVRGVAFADRGIIDNLAYCIAGNIPPPRCIIEAAERAQYTKVFLLDRLPTSQIANGGSQRVPQSGSTRRYILPTGKEVFQSYRSRCSSPR